MTRRKVKVSYIANDTARKATFKKRKRGLLKKALELSTLCGTDTCAIIYSPDVSEPVVWPDRNGVERIVARFENAPENDKSRKMLDQVRLLEKRIGKETKKLNKMARDNHEKRNVELMNLCLAKKASLEGMSLDSLNELETVIKRKMIDLKWAKNVGCEETCVVTSAQVLPMVAPPPLPPPPPPPQTPLVVSPLGYGEGQQEVGFGGYFPW